MRAPLLAAIIARIASIWFIDKSLMNPAPGFPGILMEYGVIAKNMLAGYGFSSSWPVPDGRVFVMQTSYMPPGQAWLDYLSLAAFGDSPSAVYGVFAINVLLGVLGVYVIGKLTEELFGSGRLRTTALWLAALYPPLVYSTATFGVTSAVVLINSCIFLGVIRFMRAAIRNEPTTTYAWLLGCGFGLQFFFRGEAPVFLLVTLVTMVLFLRKQIALLWPKILLVFLLPFAIIAPWTIRNYVVLDRFVLISSNGGFNFWRGNNALTTGSPWTETSEPLWATDSQAVQLQAYLGSPALYDRASSTLFFNDAVTWIKLHPGDAALLALKKGLIFWTVDTRSKMGGTVIYMSLYAITLLLFIQGLFRIGQDHRMSFGIWLIFVWSVTSTIVAMVFFPLPRLQLVMIAGYFPIVVYGADHLIQRVRHRPIDV